MRSCGGGSAFQEEKGLCARETYEMRVKPGEKSIGRRHFLKRGLWASIAALFAGTIFGSGVRPGEERPPAEVPGREVGTGSKLAG